MEKYYIISMKFETDNTAEFGYGDYSTRTPYINLIVQADTKRKAQNKAKKIDSSIRFGGMFGDLIFKDADLPSYLRGEV